MPIPFRSLLDPLFELIHRSLARPLETGQQPSSTAPSTTAPSAQPTNTEPLDPLVLLGEQLRPWVPEALRDLWQRMESQPLLSALLLAGSAYLVAKLIEVVLIRVIGRLTAKTRTQVDDRLLALVRKPIFFTVLLLGLALAARISQMPRGLTELLVDLLLTVIVLSWLGAALPGMRVVLDTLGRYRERFPLIEERTIPLFDIFSKVLLIGGATYALLAIWSLNPAPWFASAGVIGLVVGFAARDTLANLFAGIFIIADAPYRLGDFITLDSGERGLVTHVGVRSTRLLTRDDIEVTIPNAVIANAKILNESGGRWEKERLRIPVGVAYGSDVDQVCELLVGIAEEHEGICPSPEPRVRLRSFGDSSLDFELLCWIDEPVLRGRLTHEMLMEVYRTFRRDGVEIPFPQRDLWIRQAAPPGSTGDGSETGEPATR